MTAFKRVLANGKVPETGFLDQDPQADVNETMHLF